MTLGDFCYDGVMKVSPSSYHRIDSIEGDAGLAGVTYVLHGNSSVQDSLQITKTGLTVQEGRATVSTDLDHSLRWATLVEKRRYTKSLTVKGDGEVGQIFVIKVPDGLHIGYGVFTSMFVNLKQKEIKGAPIKYASGRKQLAFYEHEDTEKIRQSLEIKKLIKKISLKPEAIVAAIHPSDELNSLITSFENQVRCFEEPDISKTIDTLIRAINASNSDVMDNEGLNMAIAELVASTIESVAISRLRHLVLDVKRALGYKIILEDGDLDARSVTIENVEKQVQDLHQKVHSEGFRLGSDWLTKYLKERSEEMLAEIQLR